MKKETVLERICSAGRDEIDLYMKAAVERYREVFPEWEILYMAIPKNDPEDRRRTIQYIIEMLKKNGVDQLE